MKFIIDHWPVIAGITAAIISEIMPFLPTKYNGVAQLVLGLLKPKPPVSP